MKVFFLASARTKNLEICKKVYGLIEALGNQHTSNFLVSFDPKTFYQANEKIWFDRYRSRLKEIAQADICVFECSMHSLAVGQLLQESLRREKPVIVLHNNSFVPNFIIATKKQEKRIQILEYSAQNLAEVLKYSLENAKELLTTRFTMLMPPEYTKFLEEINTTEGLSRSEYIRNLIAEDMKRRSK